MVIARLRKFTGAALAIEDANVAHTLTAFHVFLAIDVPGVPKYPFPKSVREPDAESVLRDMAFVTAASTVIIIVVH